MTENTLKITFQQAEEHRQVARERLRQAEAGDTGEAIFFKGENPGVHAGRESDNPSTVHRR